MEMVFSHLIGDLKVTRPRRVYSSGSSGSNDGLVFSFNDSFVICCSLLLVSLRTCRLNATPLRLSPRLSGYADSRTVTACT